MENKKRFVEELGTILLMYSREKVNELKYVRDGLDEFVEIICVGYKKRINVTGDSCIAIMNDIYRALL